MRTLCILCTVLIFNLELFSPLITSGVMFILTILDKKDCNFEYRNSIFKQNKNLIILEVVFNLNKIFTPKNDYGELKNINFLNASDLREKIIEIRKNKLPDPKIIPNCGSFFKNPIISKEELKTLQEKFPEIPFFPLSERGVF